MTLEVVLHPSGSYRFLPAITAYSAGFAASEGYEITALRLLDCPTLSVGFERIDQEIERRGLPASALAGLQLRSPGAFSFETFAKFNDEYGQLLINRCLIIDGVNPISRTNVIPIHQKPTAPSIAVAFIVHPSQGRGGSDFVVAGAGEVRGELGPENIVARGDLSQKGLSLKVECVLDIMLERLNALAVTVESLSTVNVYTVHEISGLTQKIEVKLPATSRNGYTTWLNARCGESHPPRMKHAKSCLSARPLPPLAGGLPTGALHAAIVSLASRDGTDVVGCRQTFPDENHE